MLMLNAHGSLLILHQSGARYQLCTTSDMCFSILWSVSMHPKFDHIPIRLIVIGSLWIPRKTLVAYLIVYLLC